MHIIYFVADADLAHLVERHLAKVEVASSSLVIRSKGRLNEQSLSVLFFQIRRHRQVVRQRPAKPLPPVQIWVAPPKRKTSEWMSFLLI